MSSDSQNSHRDFLHDVGNILFTMQLNLERLSENMSSAEKTFVASDNSVDKSNPVTEGLMLVSKLQKLTERMGLLLEEQRKSK